MSTLKVNAIKNSSDVEMYLCKAWVNFNGTGTVAIRASGNVSSITDNGTGDYTVNFTTAMPDANYSFVFGGENDSGTAPRTYTARNGGVTTGSIRLITNNSTPTIVDISAVCVSIFR